GDKELKMMVRKMRNLLWVSMLLTLLVPGLGQGSLWQLMGQSSSDSDPLKGKDQIFSYEHDQSEGAVLNFLTDYLNAADREYVETGEYRIEYLNYDWSLNEQAR
ncbi:hypothetical protein MYX78_07540, partial [Acidobacteria bacterium AH-259-G07]|nr:hypothetical protein [Acidobacteria bacterium AH-259-G07]